MMKVRNIILLVLIAGVVLYSGFLLWRKSQPEPVRYEIVKSAYGDVERLAVFTGRIVPNEEVEIKPYIGGVLSKIYISEGDYVRKGDVIALIEVIPDMKSLTEAQSILKNKTIGLDEQRKEYERSKQLYNGNAISKSDMEEIETAYKSAEREWKQTEEDVNIIRQGYNESEESGNIWVRSTINGMVLTIPVEKGSNVVPANILNRGTTIATVGDIRTSEFVFNVDETEIDYLYVGMPIKLISGAKNYILIEGEITYISLLGQERKGAAFYEVKASFNAPETIKIPIRSSANAEISIAKKENVLLIPESAVSFENDSTFVYLADKQWFGYTYTRRPVELGLSDKQFVEVLSGIESKDIPLRGNQITSK